MSRFIKSQYTNVEEKEKKVISLKSLNFPVQEDDNKEEEQEEIVDLEAVQEQADEILEKAHQHAAAITKEAEQNYNATQEQIHLEKEQWCEEKEKWIGQAKQEGHKLGLEEGKHDGYQEYKGLIEEAKKVITLAQKDYDKHIEESEYTILHLGVKVAEKLLGTKLSEQPDQFLNIVQRAIKEVKEHQDVQIHVHPDVYELVLSQQAELKALFSHPALSLYIYPDVELNVNGCVIESSFGRIDASVDSQLHEIKIKLLELLEGDNDHERT